MSQDTSVTGRIWDDLKSSPDNDNSNNLLTINEEIKQKEKQNNNNNNKNLKSSLKSSVNNIINFPLICKALRNLNHKNIKKLIFLFRINIDHKREDKINKIINDKFLPKNEFFKFSFWFESDFEYINSNNNSEYNNLNNNKNNKFKRNTIIKTKTLYKKIERKSTKQSPSSSSKLEKICHIKSEDNTNKTIKDLLFNIWKNEKGNNFNIKDFINSLKPIKYKNDYQEKADERYFDIIFND